MTANVVVYGQNGQPVLIVLTRARTIEPDMARQLLDYMEEQAPYFLFGLVVDLQRMWFRKFGEDDAADFSCVLETPKILKHYQPEFEAMRIYGPYLGGLTETWLRDLAYHWMSAEPPGSEALGAIGLLSRIEDGTTRSEVPLGINALR